MKRYIISIFAVLLCVTLTYAQTDSRHRVASTIIADGLAQLPAKDPAAYRQVISEMAATGEDGILQIVHSVKPYGTGEKNSVFEYALSGITDYAASAQGTKCRDGVRNGLKKAVTECADKVYKRFLITLWGRVATPEDFPYFAGLTSDNDVSAAAFSVMESMKDADAKALEFITGGEAESIPLTAAAKIVGSRRLAGAEDWLISHLKGADAKTLAAVYSALAATGTQKSLKVLGDAAKAAGYAPDASCALDAYLQLLDRSADRDVSKAAALLVKSKLPATRAAGLRLMMKSAGGTVDKLLASSLKDKDIQYRNTALDFAPQYGGEKVYSYVASIFSKLSVPARTDVVRWFGNAKSKAGEQCVLSSLASEDSVLSAASIIAASKLGTPAALKAIVAQTGGKNAEQAYSALLSFTGDISEGIASAIDSQAPTSTVTALKVAGARHLHSLFSRVVALASSSDAKVKEAALAALPGVASSGDYATLASLMENRGVKDAAAYGKALREAVSSESPEKQYSLATASMAASTRPSLYYPLLAQSGTDGALKLLESKLGDNDAGGEAASALSTVKMKAAIPVLLSAAESFPQYSSSLLTHCLDLIDKYIESDVEKYLLLGSALSAKPSAAVKHRIIAALGSAVCSPSLALLRGFFDDADCKYAAATSFKDILSRVASLDRGTAVKEALEKARDICRERKEKANDADAGYAIDAIDGLIKSCIPDGGFDLADASLSLKKGEKHIISKDGENISFFFDWMNGAEGKVILRSLPVLSFSDQGVEIPGLKVKATLSPLSKKHSLAIRLVDDRLLVVVDGKTAAQNALLREAAGVKSAPVRGEMAVTAPSADLNVSGLCIAALPSTPASVLSPEEKKQGFELLFDGHNLDKWQGNTTNYTPDNGTIYVTANYGGSGNLYSRRKYSDFIYRFEFSFVSPGVNNGIGIRTNIGTDAAYDGMEIQVLDHDDPIYAGLHPYQQHGAVYGIIVPKHVKFGKPGTWNTEEIYACGDHIRVTVNGEVILDGNIREACKGHNVAPDGAKSNPYTVDHQNHPGLFNKEGYISFCGHGPGVRFRNVRILDLSRKKGK